MKTLRYARFGLKAITIGGLLALGACGATEVTERDAAGDVATPTDHADTDAATSVDVVEAGASADVVADVSPDGAGARDAGSTRTPGPWVAVPCGSTSVLLGISGSGRQTAWIVGSGDAYGSSPGDILRWDGAAWTRVASPTRDTNRGGFHDVWVNGPNEVWVVGGYQVSTTGMILRWNGSTWTQQDIPGNGVWGSGSNDVWVGGGYGTVTHWNGRTWQSLRESSGRDEPFFAFFRGAITDVWGHQDTVWFVGNAVQRSGTVVRRNPDGTVTGMVAAERDLLGVWSSGANDVWAVGDEGTTAHWNGTAWAVVPSGTRERLFGVWGSGPENVWAVGAQGTILRWRGTAWERVPAPTTRTLRALWGSGADDVWAVGDEGTILHWSE